ncbi:hypothetical protein [Streptomyces sp. NPDC001568]|uniref:hypothetical protein n=1 Tax=Streptomyces sp. NPDC001568 TaxID=3364588 RepID=UPI0036A81227
MMPKKAETGSTTADLLAYLFGPGERDEHVDPPSSPPGTRICRALPATLHACRLPIWRCSWTPVGVVPSTVNPCPRGLQSGSQRLWFATRAVTCGDQII